MKAKTKGAVLVEFDKRKKRWKARPGTIELKLAANDGVVFAAKGSNIVCFFPYPDIFTPSTAVVPVSKGKSESLTLSGKRGEFPYAVFCLDEKEFAEGDSPPMMIID